MNIDIEAGLAELDKLGEHGYITIDDARRILEAMQVKKECEHEWLSGSDWSREICEKCNGTRPKQMYHDNSGSYEMKDKPTESLADKFNKCIKGPLLTPPIAPQDKLVYIAEEHYAAEIEKARKEGVEDGIKMAKCGEGTRFHKEFENGRKYEREELKKKFESFADEYGRGLYPINVIRKLFGER